MCWKAPSMEAPAAPPPPPPPPILASEDVTAASQENQRRARMAKGFAATVTNTGGAQGLTAQANTAAPSLIGGAR